MSLSGFLELGLLPLVPHLELLEHWSSEFGKIYSETPVSFDLGLVRGVDEHWHTDNNCSDTWKLIETHHCYSLGLYGFDDIRRLAIMLWRAYLNLRTQP